MLNEITYLILILLLQHPITGELIIYQSHMKLCPAEIKIIPGTAVTKTFSSQSCWLDWKTQLR